MDITVSTSKLSETKDFYTNLLNFKIVKETPGFISFLPGQGRAKVKNIVLLFQLSAVWTYKRGLWAVFLCIELLASSACSCKQKKEALPKGSTIKTAIDYSGYLAGRGSPAKRKQNAHIHFVIPLEERQCLSN